MDPVLSFVVPTYNRASTIGRCLKSVLNSPLKGFEIIVIDDCSTDETSRVINCVEDPFGSIRYYKNQSNLGVSGSRNRGLELAIGEWVCFLDSDDAIIGDSFSLWYEKCIQYDGDIFFSKYTINTLPINIADYETQDWVQVNCEKLVMDYMSSPVGNSILTYVWAKIYNLKFIRSIGAKFNESLLIYEDMDFNANLMKGNPRIYVSSYKVYDYYVPANLSTNPIASPLGFMLPLRRYAECVNDRRKADVLMEMACGYFVVKSMLIELKKRKAINLWRFISISMDEVSNLNYKNIKHPYLRTLCQVGLNKSRYPFFLSLWIFSWFM